MGRGRGWGLVEIQTFQLSLPREHRIETPRNQNSGQALGLQWLRTMHCRGQTQVVTQSRHCPRAWHRAAPSQTSGIASPGGPPRHRVGAGREKRPYTPARGPSTDASPGTGRGWRVVTGGSGGLLRGAGVHYLAVGRRGSLRVQLPAASKEEREKKRGEHKQIGTSPSASTLGQVEVRETQHREVGGPGGRQPGQVSCTQSRGGQTRKERRCLVKGNTSYRKIPQRCSDK